MLYTGVWGCVDCRAFYGGCRGCGVVYGVGVIIGMGAGWGCVNPRQRNPRQRNRQPPTYATGNHPRPLRFSHQFLIFGGVSSNCNVTVSPKTTGPNFAGIPLATQSPSPEIKESALPLAFPIARTPPQCSDATPPNTGSYSPQYADGRSYTKAYDPRVQY